MNRFILFAVLMLACAGVGFCADEVKPPEGEVVPAPVDEAIKAKDAIAFINGYLDAGKYAPKSDFETKEEFLKRVPHYTSKDIVYLKVKIPEKQYTYDLKKNELRLLCAQSTLSTSAQTTEKWGLFGHLRDVYNIAQQSTKSTYMGQNAYGAETEIFKTESTLYQLYFTNAKQISALKIFQNGSFFVIKILPAKEAEELAASIDVVMGIVPSDYASSLVIGERESTPTRDSPFDVYNTRILVCAQLREIIWRNKDTGEIIAKIEVPEAVAPPAKPKGK